MAASPPWYDDRRGIAVVTAYAALAVLGWFVAIGALFPGVAGREWNATAFQTDPLVVPGYLYLYAGLGTLTYVFLVLVLTPDTDTRTLVRLALRIPAAVPLVVGLYLLASSIDAVPAPETPERARQLAGMAFLVGLFVEHGLKSLGAVAERVYPGDPDDLFGGTRGRF